MKMIKLVSNLLLNQLVQIIVSLVMEMEHVLNV